MNQLRNYVTETYLSLMLVGLPLFYSNQYYNITETKYHYFLYISIIYLLIAFGTILYDLIYSKEPIKEYISKIEITGSILMIITLLSTVCSKYNAWIGDTSRYQGCLSILVYILLIFVLRKSFVENKVIYGALMISFTLVCLLAFLNYINIDPLSVYETISANSRIKFISTIGNLDFYSCYLSLLFPIILTQFIKKNNYLAILLFILGCLGVCSCSSDSIAISLFISYLLTFILLVKNNKEFQKFIISLFMLLVTCYIFTHITSLFEMNIIVKLMSNLYLFLLCILILGILYYLQYKNIDINKQKKIIYLLITIIIVLFILILILVNLRIINIHGILSNYLIFSDSWGNNRGGIWNAGIKAFISFDFLQKLIGIGPDCVQYLNLTDYAEHINAMHNEYLNYLLCIGFVGLISYIVFIGNALKEIIKNNKNDIFKISLFISICCYLIQSIVNIAQPNVTPFLFIFIGIALSTSNIRNNNKIAKEKKHNKKRR